MSTLEERLKVDPALRDAARAVLIADLEHARNSFSAKGVANRVGSRLGDGALDVLETAKETASDNRGIIAALIGAILLWLGRQPLLEAFGLADAHEADTDEPTSDDISSGDKDEH